MRESFVSILIIDGICDTTFSILIIDGICDTTFEHYFDFQWNQPMIACGKTYKMRHQ